MKKLLLSMMIAALCFSGGPTWGKDNKETVSNLKNDSPEYIKCYAKFYEGTFAASILTLENMKKYDKNNKKTIEKDIAILQQWKNASNDIHDREKGTTISSSTAKCTSGKLTSFEANVSEEHSSYYLTPIKQAINSLPIPIFNSAPSDVGQKIKDFCSNTKSLVQNN